jgi:hypothetical protein
VIARLVVFAAALFLVLPVVHAAARALELVAGALK